MRLYNLSLMAYSAVNMGLFPFGFTPTWLFVISAFLYFETLRLEMKETTVWEELMK